MRLVEFISAFDTIGYDFTCVVFQDAWNSDELLRKNHYGYDEVFRGNLADIPIGYAMDYIVPYETFINWEEKALEIYTSVRPQN